MQFKQLFADDDAVSPVIGVILMVAITVILAAVIGTFVLGLGEQVQSNSPNSQFSFDYDNSSDEMDITHTSGDEVNQENFVVSSSVGDMNATAAGHAGQNFGSATDGDLVPNTDASAGTTYTIEETEDIGSSADDITSGTVRIVWQSDDGGNSDVLGSWEGPES